MTLTPHARLSITREEFLLRVSAALDDQHDTDAPPPTLPGSLVRRVRTSSGIVARFGREASAAGMTVSSTNVTSIKSDLATVLQSLSCSTVIMACADAGNARHAEQAGREAGVEMPSFSMLTRDQLFCADAAVTDVRAAVAETGSIVMNSHARRARLAHLVPPVHIALVHAEQIVPDLIDLFSDEEVRETVLSSAYTALVTGPSKTADIEGVLITGVHGPKAVHVVLIE